MPSSMKIIKNLIILNFSVSLLSNYCEREWKQKKLETVFRCGRRAFLHKKALQKQEEEHWVPPSDCQLNVTAVYTVSSSSRCVLSAASIWFDQQLSPFGRTIGLLFELLFGLPFGLLSTIVV